MAKTDEQEVAKHVRRKPIGTYRIEYRLAKPLYGMSRVGTNWFRKGSYSKEAEMRQAYEALKKKDIYFVYRMVFPDGKVEP